MTQTVVGPSDRSGAMPCTGPQIAHFLIATHADRERPRSQKIIKFQVCCGFAAVRRRWHSVGSVLTLLALLSWPALTPAAGPDWRLARESLPERRSAGVFRIHYASQGPAAFGAEAAGPGVESATTLSHELARQLQKADRFYSETLGLTPPLQSARYRGVGAIDVHLLPMPDKMGDAGDEPISYRYPAFTDTQSALSISVSTRWRPPNLTPAHELLHSYQYGYTFFKNAWYLEGLARSLENVFFQQHYRTEPLPHSQDQLDALLRRSYGAAPFWNRLMQLCNPGCPLPTGSASDGFKPRSGAICDGGFIKTLLEQLRTQDRRAAQGRRLNPDNWPETEQHAAANNPWLLTGLAAALEQRCQIKTDSELARFQALIQAAGVP